VYIPGYHNNVAKNAFTAGLDASVYGMVRQTSSVKSWQFFKRQLGHIVKSIAAHKSPGDFVESLFPECDPLAIQKLLHEGYELAQNLERPDRGGAAGNWDCAIVFTITRLMIPNEVIETGTGIGATTFMALKGSPRVTESWPRGNMTYSVGVTTFDREESITDDDAIPYYRWEELPLGGVGQLVPEEDSDRVTFVLGDIRETLPEWIRDQRLSPRTPTKALVILDSMHTPEHQQFELGQLWPVLETGSVILCDDTTYGWTDWIGSYNNCGFLGGIRK
tara:strand:- start:15433 stop:16263 length:831 start_codon:yes stop_codon:yes gene_type:complete